MARRSVTRQMQPLALRADVVPSTLDAEKRTVQVVWTTGSRVLRGFFDQYWEELSLDPKHVRMDRLNSGAAPLLNSHNAEDLSSVIGVVEAASLQKTKGIATVRFAQAADDPVADQIFRKVKDGIIKNVSVGYRVHRMDKVSAAEGEIPVYRVVDWTPHEVSMVPIGADAAATVRSPGTETNPCELTEEITMDPETETEPEATETPTPTPKAKESPALTATRAASTARSEEAKARVAGEQAAADAAVAKERTRIAEIRKLGRLHKMGDGWAQSLIEAGTSVPEARSAILEILADDDEKFRTDGTLRIAAGDDERDKWIRGASAWMFERTGTRAILEQAKLKLPGAFADVSFDPGRFRGMSPIDLARDSLERNRVDTRGMDRMQMIGRAFTNRGGNFQTAADFPILLENVLGKVLLGAYAIQNNTWQRICKTDTVPDFRTSNRYRSGSLPGLDVIAEHGEYKTGAIPDGSKYGIVAKRMGKMFALSREAIINDDMGALTNIATGLGQTAMRSIENAVYALITANSGLGPTQSDAQPFFHANRTNVNATGSAISVLGIEADAVVMANQKDPNAQDFIDLQPAILLVPRALLGTGKEINDSAYDFQADSTNSGKFLRPNRVRGLFREVVGSPRITGTRRYIIADPLDWIVVAFLEGYGTGPVLESMEGWRVDGVEWKVTIYANAQVGDPKAAVTNAGV